MSLSLITLPAFLYLTIPPFRVLVAMTASMLGLPETWLSDPSKAEVKPHFCA